MTDRHGLSRRPIVVTACKSIVHGKDCSNYFAEALSTGLSWDMGHIHHDWLAQTSEEMSRDYERLHAAVASSPENIQQTGHGAESTWVRFFKEWLPPQYEIGTRKYIVAEHDAPEFETDLVIFQPAYPQVLRQREQVLAAGVAAAFSVKLTLHRSDLEEAQRAAAALGQGSERRLGSPRGEMQRPFPFGVLAHSHGWKRPASTPVENIGTALWELDLAHADHPTKSIDFVCVADLCTWRRTYVSRMDPHAGFDFLSPKQHKQGYASTGMVDSVGKTSPLPVAVLISALYERLSVGDKSLKPLADGLRLTGTSGEGSGRQRIWELDDIYNTELLARFRDGTYRSGDPGWELVL